jgi:hypothetical protein
MPLDEKRKQYKSSKFCTVDEVSTWQDYFLKSKERLKMQCKLFMYVCIIICVLYIFCVLKKHGWRIVSTDLHVKVNWYQILN